MKRLSFFRVFLFAVLVIGAYYGLSAITHAFAQSSPKSSVAEIKKGFKGVRWGATREEFLRIRPNVSLSKGAENREKFLAYDAQIIYLFRENGKWFRMVVFVDDKVKDNISLDFTRYFGRTVDNTTRWFLEDLWITILDEKGAPILIDGLVDGFIGVDPLRYKEIRGIK